ncbi:MAG: Rid family hydrolase [Pseudomonadota bacterium]
MRAIMIVFFILLPFTAVAQDPATSADEPIRMEDPHGGAAVYIDARQKAAHDRWGFAGAYRAGDFVYLSGVVAGAWQGDPINEEEFKETLRQTFNRADEVFEAAGADIEDVVEIISFHVWDSPLFDGDKIAHLRAVADVKREFMSEPDPAWSAIGVSELLPDAGLVELRMVAYAPE